MIEGERPEIFRKHCGGNWKGKDNDNDVIDDDLVKTLTIYIEE